MYILAHRAVGSILKLGHETSRPLFIKQEGHILEQKEQFSLLPQDLASRSYVSGCSKFLDYYLLSFITIFPCIYLRLLKKTSDTIFMIN